MAKTRAEIQADYRQRQNEKLDALDKKVSMLLAKIDYLTIVVSAGRSRDDHVTVTLPSPDQKDPKTRQPRSARAHRITADWAPDNDERGYARNVELDPDVEAEKFRNYYLSCPAAKLKIDYRAAWRNWCLLAAERKGTLTNGDDRPRPATPEEHEEALRRQFPDLYT